MATKVGRLTSSTPTRGVGHPWKWRFKPCLGVNSLLDNGSHTDTSPIQFDIDDILCDGRLPESITKTQQPSKDSKQQREKKKKTAKWSKAKPFAKKKKISRNETLKLNGYEGFLPSYSKLSPRQFLLSLYIWSIEFTKQPIDNLGLNIPSRKTRSKVNKQFGGMCTMVVDKYPIKLGGKCKDSQNDELMFRKTPKNHSDQAFLIDKKRAIDAYGPIFGAPEKYDIKVNLVGNRKTRRCNQFVKDYIAIDTRIKTDQWKGYLDLSSLSSSSSGTTLYTNNTVEHKDYFVIFVDPETGTHTNGIERMWGVVKNRLRRVRGVRTADLQDYLNEFEVRFNFCGMDNRKLF